MTDTIKLKAGNKSGMPTLADRELAYCRDEQALYIGTPEGNVKLGGSGGGGGGGVLSVVSGQSIRVTDVSPFKHDLSVSVNHGNLLDLSSMVNSSFALTDDGCTITKTASNRASGYMDCALPAGTAVTYAVDSWEGTAVGNLTLQVVYDDGSVVSLMNLNAGLLSNTKTLAKNATRFRLIIASTEENGAYITLTGLKLLNSSATSLETTVTYNGQEYSTTADGSVEGLVSTSPTMTLSVPSGYALTLVYYKKI